jgi:hypothetical protein
VSLSDINGSTRVYSLNLDYAYGNVSSAHDLINDNWDKFLCDDSSIG